MGIGLECGEHAGVWWLFRHVSTYYTLTLLSCWVHLQLDFIKNQKEK